MKHDLVSLLLLLLSITSIQCYRVLSPDALQRLSDQSVPETLDRQTGRLLAPLLVERVVGTPSHAKVRQFILGHFDTLGWHVELDSFTSNTPVGTKNFTNIIATQDPTAARRLVLAAHYDSMPMDGFIGATDSAVPCALLLSLAESLDGLLQTPGDVSLELVFFDGEEAMVHWSDSDSIYGAKHLASTWENKARLGSIDVMVLLDLMGNPNPTFHNYFMSTNWLFQNLANLETRLAAHWQHVGQLGQDLLPMFPTTATRFTFDGTAMSDDHLPFKDRGVNILHLIPYPFPNEWHTLKDNADCLDPPTIRNLDLLFRAFVCEYLELDPSLV